MKKDSLIGHLSLLGANLIYGANFVIAKGIMSGYMSPRAIVFIRIVGSALLFWLFSLIGGREKVERKDLFKLAVCSIFGVTLNQTLFFEGLNLTTTINSSIIMTLNPILVLVFSYIIIKEKITFFKIIGIILGATGAAYLILSHGDISFSSATFVGNLFIVVNASSFALYMVIVKPLMVKYNPWTVMKWVFLFGFIFLAPFATHKVIACDFAAVPDRIWISLAYVVIFATFLGYLFYNFALKRVSPVLAGTYIYLQPLFATIIAIFIGEDTLTYQAVISAILIFTGVYFVSRRKKIIK